MIATDLPDEAEFRERVSAAAVVLLPVHLDDDTLRARAARGTVLTPHLGFRNPTPWPGWPKARSPPSRPAAPAVPSTS